MEEVLEMGIDENSDVSEICDFVKKYVDAPKERQEMIARWWLYFLSPHPKRQKGEDSINKNKRR